MGLDRVAEEDEHKSEDGQPNRDDGADNDAEQADLEAKGSVVEEYSAQLESPEGPYVDEREAKCDLAEGHASSLHAMTRELGPEGNLRSPVVNKAYSQPLSSALAANSRQTATI